tara:strand:+ start:351 stop:497 length:147 start_codon:yes stop_codon:yes gene_type:complete
MKRKQRQQPTLPLLTETDVLKNILSILEKLVCLQALYFIKGLVKNLFI